MASSKMSKADDIDNKEQTEETKLKPRSFLQVMSKLDNATRKERITASRHPLKSRTSESDLAKYYNQYSKKSEKL